MCKAQTWITFLLLPEQASLLHLCHKSGLQHKDRLYNGPPLHLYHRPCQLPHHSSMDLYKYVKQTIQSLIHFFPHKKHLHTQKKPFINHLLTLWSRETIRWPAERVAVCAQDGILLLHAKPGMLVLHHLHHLLTCDAKVGFCRNNAQIRRLTPCDLCQMK